MLFPKQKKREVRELQDIKNPTEKEEKIIQWVKQHLSLSKNWFIIYDNVANFKNLRKYYPSDQNAWGSGRVIMTTRNSEVQNSTYVTRVLPIRELSDEQKLSLFVKIAMDSDNSVLIPLQIEQAKNFLKAIPSFPLDVAIAAHYLKATNVSYNKYLGYLKEGNSEFEKIQKSLLEEVGEYNKTRQSIINLTMKKIIDADKNFKDFLLLITLVDSQNIPRDLLSCYKDGIPVDNFIYHLKKYSLITNDSSSSLGYTFSLHRSTQDIGLSYLVKKLGIKRSGDQLLRTLVATLQNYMVGILENEDVPRMNLLLNHGEAFLKHTALSNLLKNYIKGTLGEYYFYFSNYEKSAPLLRESLKILSRNFSDNHIQISRILMCLGTIEREKVNYKSAKNLLEQSLIIYQQYQPQNHSKIAEILIHLGMIDREQGNYNKAKNLFKKSLTIYQKYDPKNYRTDRALGYLGVVHINLGDYKGAKPFLEQALINYKEHQSEAYVTIDWIWTYLAMAYKELGYHKKAKNCFQQGLITYKKHIFKNNSEISWLFAHAGIVCRELGYHEDAKNFFNKSLTYYKKNYDKDHIKIGWVLMNLGQVYLLENKLGTAEKFINQSFEILQENKHPESYMCLEILSDIYLKKYAMEINKKDIKQSQLLKERSISYLKQALQIVTHYFPKHSPHISRIESKIKNWT